MLCLGIETSCDETAAAVVRDGFEVLSSVVASQTQLHKEFGGVVPELACRAHIKQLLPVLRESLDGAKVKLQDVDLIGVCNTPGLIGALLVGVSAAKALAVALKKPVVGVDHVQAHAYSALMWARTDGVENSFSDYGMRNAGGTGVPPVKNHGQDAHATGNCGLRIENPNSEFRIPHSAFRNPLVALVASGGHTSLYRLDSETSFERLGGTTDDAAGEAFDKVAAILGLEYPGGPSIEKVATAGNPKAINFPRSYLGWDSLDFSFSGIKTAVLYLCKGRNALKTARNITEHSVADIAASFQEAIVDVLVVKTLRAAEKVGARGIVLGGGVAANKRLRERLTESAAKIKLPTIIPPPAMCTDNAAMVAGLATALAREGKPSDLTLDAVPTWHCVPGRGPKDKKKVKKLS